MLENYEKLPEAFEKYFGHSEKYFEKFRDLLSKKILRNLENFENFFEKFRE